MGDLFFNKLAGAIIGIGLLIMGLMELCNRLFEPETPDTLAIAVDLSDVAAAAEPEEEVDTGPVDFGVLLANANVSAGERVARRCASCHNFEEGEGNKAGPYLWDVMGREVGVASDFGYSSAMNEYAAGGTVWGYQNMYDYLEAPADYVEGTAMIFRGLSDQEDRINLIAYMRSKSSSPIDIPDPLPTVVEDAVEEVTEEAAAALDAAADTAAEIIEGATPVIEDPAAEEPVTEEPEGEDPGDEGGEGEDG